MNAGQSQMGAAYALETRTYYDRPVREWRFAHSIAGVTPAIHAFPPDTKLRSARKHIVNVARKTMLPIMKSKGIVCMTVDFVVYLCDGTQFSPRYTFKVPAAKPRKKESST